MSRKSKFLSAILGAVASGGVMMAAPSAAEENGPYVHYKFPQAMMSMGGKSSANVNCGLFGRDIARPTQLFGTCAIAEVADNGTNPGFCAIQVPAQTRSNSRLRIQKFADVEAKVLDHFDGMHGLCRARDASRKWQVAAQRETLSYRAQNPNVSNVQLRQVFNDNLVRLMDRFNIPKNPANPDDLNFRKDPKNWPLGSTNCPIDRIADMCKAKMGLD